ncbi:hypothetical protein PVAG01_01284 [Phlyctema vagabunda]|uniref:Uncharacterized protein n=1 Tax=Phlyctema vagabunda TaxID=108571 RepID=A0ABR4PX28_9HELO
MLTLASIKPCTLIAHYTAQEIFTQMIEQCLKPVMEKFGLQDYGFTLRQITHPMPTTIHDGFQHAWIFADMRSDKWKDVRQVFLAPLGREATELEIGNALGYPSEGGERQITYMNATERDILKKTTGKDICCVPGFEYTSKPGNQQDWHIMLMHFMQSTSAAETVGVDLAIDLEGFPEMKKWFENIRQITA